MKTIILEQLVKLTEALDECQGTSDLAPTDKATWKEFVLDLQRAHPRLTALDHIDDTTERQFLIVEISNATSMIREGQSCSREFTETVARVIRGLDSVIMDVEPIEPWPRRR